MTQTTEHQRAEFGTWLPNAYRQPQEVYTVHNMEVAFIAGMQAAQPGWCDGCSPDNCCGCGIAATTHPTQQGLDLANYKGGKWLTVVYRGIQPGDEARTIGEHPKVSALSWSHALHDRDVALAAQAKQGEKQ